MAETQLPIRAAIAAIRAEAEARASAIQTADDAEQFRIHFLARKGGVGALFDEMHSVPPEQKPLVGKQLNELRAGVTALYEEAKTRNAAGALKEDPQIDLSLPGKFHAIGSTHPITQTIEDMKRIFASMGFAIADGPEIEDDYHNFGALNFAPDHPARDMQDTFFVDKDVLLRTHTSPVQIRVMQNQKPPIRAIMPGRVYRNEAVSARSYCLFHQVEGLYVDKNVTFSELKGTLVAFAKEFYGSSLKYKFRPSFFPFTEPSLEMDITCFLCKGKGCRMCKESGWLEVLGAGMVHPNVLKNCDIDPEIYTGFAFGTGIERIAILRHGIPDIRMLFENDLRFLKQF